jgi:hypothetical protein
MTAVEMLHQVRGELEADSITLYVTRDIGQVREVLARTEPDVVGMFPSVQAAVEQISGREPPGDRG